MMNFANEAFEICKSLPGEAMLDIGSGNKQHAEAFEQAGWKVTTLDSNPNHRPDIVSAYPAELTKKYDLVWCSHTLEHALDPHAFLQGLRADCRPGGYIAITVPPMKQHIVGGHVNLFNAGLLLYRMVLAGIPCQNARVKTYGYNVTVIVQKVDAGELFKTIRDQLLYDCGDIATLAPWLPPICRVQGYDGDIEEYNWL